jgi:hypothetical protein
VQNSSATFDDPTFEIVESVSRNHVGMTKFFGKGDPEYVKFKDALERLVKIASEAPGIVRGRFGSGGA